MNDDDIGALLLREEELLDQLKPSLMQGPLGLMIHHPILMEIAIDPKRCALVNRRFIEKTRAVEAARKEKNWSRYIFLHERPYRLGALISCQDVATPHELCELLRSAWIDCENVYQNIATWRYLWRRQADNRSLVMSSDELAQLEQLPDVIPVYRGAHPKSRRGLSWSLDRDRAAWFGKRLRRDGEERLLVHGRVRKTDVYALLLARNEKEIVAENVRVTRTEEL